MLLLVYEQVIIKMHFTVSNHSLMGFLSICLMNFSSLHIFIAFRIFSEI